MQGKLGQCSAKPRNVIWHFQLVCLAWLCSKLMAWFTWLATFHTLLPLTLMHDLACQVVCRPNVDVCLSSRCRKMTLTVLQSLFSHAGDDLEGFLASESEEEERPAAKRSRVQKSGQQRTARAKLDWSDSSSESHGKSSSHEPAVKNITHIPHGGAVEDDASGTNSALPLS